LFCFHPGRPFSLGGTANLLQLFP
jgi:hypothetical protein